MLLVTVAVGVNRVYADKIEAAGTERDVENERMMIKNCVLKVASEESGQTITGTKIQEQMKRYIGAEKVTTKDDKTAKTIEITYAKSGRTYTLKTDTLEILGREPEIEKQPYIPKGFNEVIGTDLKKGYTIEDGKGNQYVWVEVPQTEKVYPTAGLNITTFTESEYTKIETDLHTYTNDYRDGNYNDKYYSDATTGLTSTQYTELKRKMLKSVYQNGGFYVGKYEAGKESDTKNVVIKKNAYPYNDIICSQAQTLASNMESGEYTSSLMFGVQWDLILKYLETKGIAQSDLKTDSTSWGNYYNNLWNITNVNSKYSTNHGINWINEAYGQKNSNQSIILSSGASEEFAKQGIYDLAGNLWEWTLEYCSHTNVPCTNRGGSFYQNGDKMKAFTHNNSTISGAYNDIGFRIVIY